MLPQLILATMLFMFFFAAAAISPAFGLLQHLWGFSALSMTVAFASYSLTLLAALILLGPSSDYIGRKPVLAVALVIQFVAMLMFYYMHDIQGLIVARATQGIATGIANACLAAAIIDNSPGDRKAFGAFLTGISPLFGLAMGAIISGYIVQNTSSPVQHLFGALAILTALFIMLLQVVNETVQRKSGVLQSITPKLALSHDSLRTIWKCTPALVTTWSVGCIYLTLVPIIFKEIFHIHDYLQTGLSIALLYFSACVSSVAFKQLPASRVNMISLILLMVGLILLFIAEWCNVPDLFKLGTLIAGIGFGGGFSSSIKEIGFRVPHNERAAAFALVFIISYLALAIPALIAGYSADHIGIYATILIFNVILVMTAIIGISLMAKTNQVKV